MYSTHSDESYVPDDGTESKWKNAGIYDVGESLKHALEALGIDAVYSRETFLPHDADAYTRSRRTAEELLKKGPDALIDVHRDAVPANQYETKVDGDDVSKVRLFVGRSNPNAAANKAFARQLKAAADEAYPGLVKDIFIGRGNYNQELYPHAILLEFGTHKIDKDKAIASTKYMANVLNAVLYGGAASGTGRGAGLKSAMKGAGWAVLALAVAAAAYALLATGSAPRRLPVPGADADNVLHLRYVQDSDRIRDALRSAEQVVIIGAGWIGLEVAAAARAADTAVTVVEIAVLIAFHTVLIVVLMAVKAVEIMLLIVSHAVVR